MRKILFFLNYSEIIRNKLFRFSRSIFCRYIYLMTGINSILDKIVPLPPLNSETLGDWTPPPPTKGKGTFADSVKSLTRPAPQPELSNTYHRPPTKTVDHNPDDPLMDALREFEGYILGVMLKNMGKNFAGSNMFDESYQSSFYKTMFFQELAKAIAENGSGLGIADVIYRDIMLKASEIHSE